MEQPLLIALPAYNEEQNIAYTIENTFRHGDVIVFNNNSTDNTKNIAESLGCKVINVSDIGYESVIYSIVDFFIESNYKKLIILDGDGEVGLESIPEAIRQLNFYDAVVGQRNSINRMGEKIVCKLFDIRYSIKDIYCGFKCFNKKGISSKRSLNTFGTSIVNKDSSVYNLPLKIKPRNDVSKLGNSIKLNIKLLIYGIRGFLN